MRMRRGPGPPPVAAAGCLSWYIWCGIRKPPGARATSICAGRGWSAGSACVAKRARRDAGGTRGSRDAAGIGDPRFIYRIEHFRVRDAVDDVGIGKLGPGSDSESSRGGGVRCGGELRHGRSEGRRRRSPSFQMHRCSAELRAPRSLLHEQRRRRRCPPWLRRFCRRAFVLSAVLGSASFSAAESSVRSAHGLRPGGG